MCIIVDANRLGDFPSDPVKPDSAPIRRWLDRGGGRLVYSTGAAFAREIGKRDKLLAYVRAGKASVVPADGFAEDEQALRSRADLRSDDPHVLALARATGVRVLYTSDRSLMDDFKRKDLIDRPRGTVYSGAANADFLARATCGLTDWRRGRSRR